jgi:hypothetical protein
MECRVNDQRKQSQVQGSERPHWVETVDRIRRERRRCITEPQRLKCNRNAPHSRMKDGSHSDSLDRIRSVAQRSVPLDQSPRSGNAARFGIDEPRRRTSDSPMDIVFTCGYGDLMSDI